MRNNVKNKILDEKQVEELSKMLIKRYVKDNPSEAGIKITGYLKLYESMADEINRWNQKFNLNYDGKKQVSGSFIKKIIFAGETETSYQIDKLNLCYLYATGKSYWEYFNEERPLEVFGKGSFEREFLIWVGSGKRYNLPHPELLKLSGYFLKASLKPEEYVFVLHSAVYYGDETMVILTEKCKKDREAVEMLFNSLAGRGIRVGWRAEYLFSHLDRDLIEAHFRSLPEPFRKTEPWKSCIARIRHNQTWDYLQEFANGVDPKLRSYANEVIVQINKALLKYNGISCMTSNDR